MSDPNIVCLAQIASNGVAICGDINGVTSLIGALIIYFNRNQLYANKLLMLGVSSLTLGVVIPPLIKLLLPDQDLAAAILGLGFFLPLAAGGIWSFMLPARLWKLSNPNVSNTALAFLLGAQIFPFGWHLALWWLTKPKKEQVFGLVASGDSSPELRRICGRTTAVMKMLQQANEKEAAARLYTIMCKEAPAGQFYLNLNKALDRILFDCSPPENIADEIRALTEEISQAQRSQD